MEDKDYLELKKIADKSDKFIKIVNNLKIDDKDIPKTEKGMNSKAKELMDRINKKLSKITEDEFIQMNIEKSKLRKDIDTDFDD